MPTRDRGRREAAASKENDLRQAVMQNALMYPDLELLQSIMQSDSDSDSNSEISEINTTTKLRSRSRIK
jgi:hypothetical protein